MLTLLRHGLEEAPNSLHGWQDVPLLEKGVEQAVRAAEYLQATRYRDAYTSDLTRAADTAALVAGKQPALVALKTPHLRSLNLGLLQGKPYAEVEAKLNALWAEWRNGNDGLRAPDGESWAEFQGRVYPFMFRMQQEAANADVLAVSHSHVCNYAAAVAMNGGRPLFGGALDLVKRFEVLPGNAVEFRDGMVSRLNYIR